MFSTISPWLRLNVKYLKKKIHHHTQNYTLKYEHSVYKKTPPISKSIRYFQDKGILL